MYKFIEKMKNNLPLGEIGEELLNECVKLKARIEQQEEEKLRTMEIIEKIKDQHCDSDPLRKLLNEALKSLEVK